MAVLLIPPYLQFFDANGDPLSLGKVYTYAAGTNTPKATFTDNTSNTQASNPVILDSAGRTTMWGSGSYKFAVYDANDNLIETTDNYATYTTIESEADTYFQAFSGTGSQTAFTLSTNLGTDENAIMVFVSDGLEQHVTNGTFATDTAWTKGAGWTIGSGVATATGAISTALSQTSAVTLIEGQSYSLIYTVTRSAGGIIPSIGGTNGTERTTNGTYRETIIAGSTQTIAFTGNAFTGTVDTITITPSDFKGYDIQAPTSYTLSGTTLTFGTAPPSGTGNIYVFAPSALVAAASASADAADASATIATNAANTATTQAGLATTAATTATTQAGIATAAASSISGIYTAPTAGAAATLALLEATGNGTSKALIAGPASIASDITVTLPAVTSTLATLAGTETFTNKTNTNGRFNQLLDTNGNVMLGMSATASAVNYFNISNAAAGFNPGFSVAGTDPNINFNLQAKGTGNVRAIPGSGSDIFQIFNGAQTFNASISVASLAGNRTFTLPDATTTFVGTDVAQTLTNKTVNLTSNTLSGTIAQFNTACSDADFATLAGSETLTNKTITSGRYNQITDTNGNAVIGLTANATAVNFANIANAAAGGNPVISAQGTSSDINLNLQAKGTGACRLIPGSGSNIAQFFNGAGTFAANVSMASLTATRTFTFPDATTTFVGTDATQTLSAKTFTDPIMPGVVLGSNFDKTADTTLAAVTGFSINATAAGRYIGRVVLDMTSNVAGGVKVALVGTGGLTATTYRSNSFAYNAGILTQALNTTLGNNEYAVTAVTATKLILEIGLVVNVAGTLNVQFAQNVSNGTASTVLAGSSFTLQRVL